MRLTRPPCAPSLLSAACSPKTKVHRASSKCFVIIFQEQLDQQTCYLCKTEGSTAKTWTMVNTIKMDAMVKGPNATQTNPARPSQVKYLQYLNLVGYISKVVMCILTFRILAESPSLLSPTFLWALNPHWFHPAISSHKIVT